MAQRAGKNFFFFFSLSRDGALGSQMDTALFDGGVGRDEGPGCGGRGLRSK